MKEREKVQSNIGEWFYVMDTQEEGFETLTGDVVTMDASCRPPVFQHLRTLLHTGNPAR